jgi:hypothetical protein
VFAVLGCGDIGCDAMPPGCADPLICPAMPPEDGGAECHPPFEGGAGERDAAPALAEPGSGLSRPICPGGGVLECQPPVEGEPAFGEFDGVTACHPAGAPVAGTGAVVVGCAPGIELALPPP